MPRFSQPVVDPSTGKVIGIACGSYRRKRCKTCKPPALADLACDGCDHPVCRACAVSPRKGIDFCPACFEGAWKHWCEAHRDRVRTTDKWTRRALFRAWALAEPEAFLKLAKPISAAGVQARARPAGESSS